MNVKEFSIHVFHCSVIKVPVVLFLRQLLYYIRVADGTLANIEKELEKLNKKVLDKMKNE